MRMDIFTTPTEKIGKARRFLIFQTKMWWHCGRLLKKNKAGQVASALSYSTVFGIVPLAILIVYIFQLFPGYSDLGMRVRTFVYEQFNLTNIEYTVDQGQQQQVMLTDYINRIIEQFFEGVNKGSVTIISLMIVVIAALVLLSTIEKAFNNMYHVTQGRNILQRVVNYWTVLTFGPILLGVGIFVSTQYAAVAEMRQTVLSATGPAVLSYLISVLGFFLLYFVLPNTKVQVRSALWGAAVAALVWSVAKWGFGIYVTKFIPYQEVYGVLGLIPLAIFWVFVSWVIVLFGLQLAFTTQHLKSLDRAQIEAAKRHGDQFIADNMTVIGIMQEVADAFEAGKAPISIETICSKFSMPADFGEKLLNRLVKAELLARTDEPREGFVPAKDPENIKLSDIRQVVLQAGFGHFAVERKPNLAQVNQAENKALQDYTLKEVIEKNYQLQQPLSKPSSEQGDNSRDEEFQAE